MAPSGPAAAASLLAPAASPLPCRQLRPRQPPLRHFSLSTYSPVTAAAIVLAASTRSSASSAWCWMPHGSLIATNCRTPHASLSLRLGVAIGPTSRCFTVLARCFKEGSSLGGLGDMFLPEAPVSQPSGDATGPRCEPSAQGQHNNAVPFVPSTRQRHRRHDHHRNRHAAAAVAGGNVSSAEGPAVRGNGGSGGDSAAVGVGVGTWEEAEAYADPDEEIRRRAHALRAAMVSEAEQRAIALHPSILVDDLAAEATVPYDAAGSPYAQGGDEEGEAAGRPSRGAGPHHGLVVESVELDREGFTVSLPAVDPAYDDVGRAIRQEQAPGAGPRPRSSLLAAEARARKAATAEDLREALLDAAPELQDAYRAFGLARAHDLSRRGALTGGGRGPVAANDDEVQELIEAVPLGPEGAVLAEEAEMPAEAASALVDPLGSAAGGVGDPLAALDALEHRKLLELLESGGVAGSTASTGDDDGSYADIANIMPSPPSARIPIAGPRSGAAAATSSSSSSKGGDEMRKVSARIGAHGPRIEPSRRRLVLASTRSAGFRGASPQPGSSYPPPFYHTSPDVPDEELDRRQQRSRPRRRTVPTTADAAADAHASRGGGDVAIAGGSSAAGAGLRNDAQQHAGKQRAQEPPVDGGAICLTGSVNWLRQAPLYNNNPDVPDEEVESPAGAAAKHGALTPRAGAASQLGNQRAEPDGDGVNAGGSGEATLLRATVKEALSSSPLAAAAAAATQKHAPRQAPLSRPPQQQLQRQPSPRASSGDGRRLSSLGDVDRQFIDMDAAGSWHEQAQDLLSAMRGTVPKQGHKVQLDTGARGADSPLQPQTIGIHGSAVSSAAASAGNGSINGDGGSGSSGGADGRPVMVMRVEWVPSQTYGVARTAAVLAADGKLTLLARPTGPSPERVRAALKLLRMAPDSRDFKTSAAEAAAAAANNDERNVAAATEAAVAAAMAAVGTPGLEMEAQLRPPSPGPSMDGHDLQPGLILGQSEIDPEEVQADPNFPLDSSWTEQHGHRNPHDPHVAPPCMEVEGHALGQQLNMLHEDYDEVMGQIYDGQRSGWSEDAVNGMFDSDVY